MNSVELFANMIMKEACRVQASDLHIVPRQKDVAIQLRIGKDLITKRCIEKEFGEKLVSHFKFLASMDIGERRKPQNGSLYLQIDGSRSVFTPFNTSNSISRKSSYSPPFTSICSAIVSSFVISKYSGKITLFFKAFSWVTRIYWADWFWKNNDNVCVIRSS